MKWCSVFFVLGFGLTASFAGVRREHVNLNGAWQVARVESLDAAVPQEGWKEIRVPGHVTGWRYERAWYRRSFQAPANWKGLRIKLVLAGAKYCPVVFINGQKVGRHFGGYEPCEFDISAAVRVGQENDLRIGLNDWTALFKAKPVEFPETIEWHALRAFPRDRVVYPIGGRFTEFGLWDDVLVYAVPAVYVADAFVRTDVQRRELRGDYEIVNETKAEAKVRLSGQILDGGKMALSLGEQELVVEPGKTTRVSLKTTWPEGRVKLWSPEQPKLYTLSSRLDSPAGTDARADRFGFRQFTIKGHNFYLNGVRRNLLASSAWPMAPHTRQDIADALGRLKQANVICFRTHTQPWRQIWYDVADEVGLLMIPEGAVWNDDATYRLDDMEFWRNWGAHLGGMVRSLRNHPSVIMWSLENEFFGRRAGAGSIYEQRLAELGRLVKREDPTRPIYYESDGDPGGVADVIGLHYPHEPPTHRLWPNDAYWMDSPVEQGSSRMFWPTKDFTWDRRKPLYIGEYLWWPSGVPGGYTLIHGDQAYRDLRRARVQAKAAVWRWQTIAYRHYEVGGICPWTLVEGGPLDLDRNPVMAAQAYAMQPLAAYVREETRRVYAGSKVEFHLEVFNDLPQPVAGTLRWEFVSRNAKSREGRWPLDLQPGAHVEKKIDFVAPPVTQHVEGTLRVRIERNGRVEFSDERPLSIYPRPRLVQPATKLFLFDRPGPTAKLLGEHDIKVQPVERLSEFRAVAGSVLIIGEEALTEDHQADPWAAWKTYERLRRFVVDGGRVIVLQQNLYPAGLPAELNAEAQSTMSFLQVPDHPLLKGLPDDACKFWQPDHVVTVGELRRPKTGGFVPLVVTGHPDGISHCALLEARRGRGIYLLCQLPLVARLSAEPMAAELLGRLLDYAARYAGRGPDGVGKVLLAGGDKAYEQSLERIRLRHQSGQLKAESLKARSVALMRGSGEMDLAALTDWVRGGGQVLLDRPPAATVAAIGKAVGLKLRVDPYGGPCLRTEGDGELIKAIAREDLYWIGAPPSGPRWHRQPLASNVATGALAFDVDVQPAAKFGPDQIEIQGHLVRRINDHIAMATVGTGQVEFTASKGGKYLIRVEARGTPCDGVHAVAVVTIDGDNIGFVNTARQWRHVTLPVHLAAGKHEIILRFINDRNAPPEDRNFFLRSIAIGPVPKNLATIQPIASGATVALIPLGRGRIVLSFLQWDRHDRNAAKGRRFFASLLTALGADFADLSGVSYDPTTFTPMRGIANYKKQNGNVYMGSNGWIEGHIDVPVAGNYGLLIEAAGTKADDEYPQVAVWLDGNRLTTIELSAEVLREYTFHTPMTAGRHALRLQFINDYYKPPEDRNLRLGRLRVVPTDRAGTPTDNMRRNRL